MGEVYRARDMQLGRDVAISVLDAVAADPDCLMRLSGRPERSPRSTTRIAQVYGLETSGHSRAIVMELVDGEDLAERIGRGAVPLDEAIAIARQIADALETAHDAGIVHRDLKPANVADARWPREGPRLRSGQSARLRRRQGDGRRGEPANAHVPRDDAGGHHPRHRRVYGARASARTRGRSTRRSVGAGLRPA